MAAPALADTTTRDAILDEAEARFAERGYDATSMRDVATASGLRNQASLYHYFENKQAMYAAVLSRGIDSIVAAVSPTSAAAPGGVAPYLDAVLDVLGEHPQLARLIQRASLEDSPASRELVGRVVQPLYDAGLRMLGTPQSAWDADELPHLAAGLYHLIFGYYANTALLGAVMSDDPAGPRAMERQRRFVHRAVERLLGGEEGTGAST